MTTITKEELKTKIDEVKARIDELTSNVKNPTFLLKLKYTHKASDAFGLFVQTEGREIPMSDSFYEEMKHQYETYFKPNYLIVFHPTLSKGEPINFSENIVMFLHVKKGGWDNTLRRRICVAGNGSHYLIDIEKRSLRVITGDANQPEKNASQIIAFVSGLYF